MSESITQRMHGLPDGMDFQVSALMYVTLVDMSQLHTQLAAVIVDLIALRSNFNSGLTGWPGLVCGTVSKKMPKTATAVNAMVNGVLVNVAAGTPIATPVGTVAQNKFALWAFYVTQAGAFTVSTKTADTTTAAGAFALMPPVPLNCVQLGFIIVTNSGSGGFVGTTDDLDKAGNTVIYADSYGFGGKALPLTSASLASLSLAT